MSTNMEKVHELPSETTQISDLKDMAASEMATDGKDIDLGQILQVETSPELERRVLMKIDYMSVHSRRRSIQVRFC